jgi:hypothetical protein
MIQFTYGQAIAGLGAADGTLCAGRRRFIAYHALIALITAADHPHVLEHLNRIETAAIESGKGLPEGSERWNAWCRLTERIASLRNRTH